jgi:hypothetical protein
LTARCQHGAPWFSRCWKCLEVENEYPGWVLDWEYAPADQLVMRLSPCPDRRGWGHFAALFRDEGPRSPTFYERVSGMPVLWSFPLAETFWWGQSFRDYVARQMAARDRFFEFVEQGWDKVAKAFAR